MDGPALRSMPAQKKRLEVSDDVRMMARTRGSVERVLKAVIRDVAIVSVKEFGVRTVEGDDDYWGNGGGGGGVVG